MKKCIASGTILEEKDRFGDFKDEFIKKYGDKRGF